jgi:hypothetical protein
MSDIEPRSRGSVDTNPHPVLLQRQASFIADL